MSLCPKDLPTVLRNRSPLRLEKEQYQEDSRYYYSVLCEVLAYLLLLLG